MYTRLKLDHFPVTDRETVIRHFDQVKLAYSDLSRQIQLTEQEIQSFQKLSAIVGSLEIAHDVHAIETLMNDFVIQKEELKVLLMLGKRRSGLFAVTEVQKASANKHTSEMLDPDLREKLEKRNRANTF